MRKLTSHWAVGDGKHFASKLLFLNLLDKLSSLGYETLDTSILPVSHTNFLFVRKEHQTVGDPERCASPPV